MTKLRVSVTYQHNVGYVSTATHTCPRSLTALSLEGLRKRVLVVAALRRRASEELMVVLELDPSAQAEYDRRRAAAGL